MFIIIIIFKKVTITINIQNLINIIIIKTIKINMKMVRGKCITIKLKKILSKKTKTSIIIITLTPIIIIKIIIINFHKIRKIIFKNVRKLIKNKLLPLSLLWTMLNFYKIIYKITTNKIKYNFRDNSNP